MLTAIAAVSENNIIGEKQKLLWHLPDDFKRFKRLTQGHRIIMGRKTFESLPGLLPLRTHIVLTSQKDYQPEGVFIYHSLDSILELIFNKDYKSFVIGGGEIYRLLWNNLKKIELTRVHHHFNGDTTFPDINPSEWSLIYSKYHQKDKKHTFDFSYETYIRI